jgi:hypothetical protein
LRGRDFIFDRIILILGSVKRTFLIYFVWKEEALL